ncbi:DUF488 domain-containing protein [Halobacterium rubrum]|uniref:DUF488 domain-containing protein n=1 Tax=Halobacterium TaxID=2239 RepID=UPI001F262F23|nr:MULTISPECIES: DUF488 family protein [Halobacterium]MDH5019400.1 DUF488 family protein [Halobacterium rubrum]
MEVRTKRVYEDPAPGDGARVLVDCLWPRGVSKDEAALDNWAKSVAPTDELHEHFDHDPERWAAFQREYRAELDDERGELRSEVLEYADDETLTLVWAASDETHNNAVVLAAFLREELL